MTVVYKYIKDHQPKEMVCSSVDAAERQAIADMDKGNVYPREIIVTVMDRAAIKQKWENQLQLAA